VRESRSAFPTFGACPPKDQSFATQLLSNTLRPCCPTGRLPARHRYGFGSFVGRTQRAWAKRQNFGIADCPRSKTDIGQALDNNRPPFQTPSCRVVTRGLSRRIDGTRAGRRLDCSVSSPGRSTSLPGPLSELGTSTRQRRVELWTMSGRCGEVRRRLRPWSFDASHGLGGMGPSQKCRAPRSADGQSIRRRHDAASCLPDGAATCARRSGSSGRSTVVGAELRPGLPSDHEHSSANQKSTQ